MMNKLFLLLAILLAENCFAQTKFIVPLTAENWDYKQGAVEFIDYQGQKAIKLDENSGDLFLKDYQFKDGTIEFDVEVNQPGPFPTIYFRAKNENTEHVYLRTGPAGKENAFDLVQYASIINNVNLWDLQHEYQTSATIFIKKWNHVKVVVSGQQLRVYINSQVPNLEVPCMEGVLQEGRIGIGTGFIGEVIFANLIVKPNETEGLPAEAGPDITSHDTRYLRNWEVTEAVDLPYGKEVIASEMPKEKVKWETIKAERRGLVNLSRKFGLSQTRRMVWLKTTLSADAPQTQELKLGFSDEVWVFVNGAPVYIDKNLYIQNMRKSPNGRISIDNSSFPISLKEGENTIMIAVANDFYGWGIMARLAHVNGIDY